MHANFLLERFQQSAAAEAIIWRDRPVSYAELLELYQTSARQLQVHGVAPGTVVSLEADFSPASVAMFLALIQCNCIVVPLTSSVQAKKPEFRGIAEIERIVEVRSDDRLELFKTGRSARHPLLTNLKSIEHPGLILFSSGSTGKSKAAVHDFVPLLQKFKVPRKSKRLISFLLFDHIGGVNTLFYCLSNAGCLIIVPERTPESVAKAIEDHRVEILPTSPTFLNLLLMSEAYKRHTFESLELVTYGTEPMPQHTLQRMNELFPGITLQQTYGLSELGILRSKSKANDSLWVKVGGEGFAIRVVDGLLEIKAESAMLGYLNAESPFTEDGWFKTGDLVEVDGEYLRILGRQSEIINVGGEKVYPAEVESLLQTMEGVSEVVVSAEPNAIVGNIVRAVFRLSTDESVEQLRKRMRAFCKGKLPAFKIPQRVVISDSSLHSERFKKIRNDPR